MRTSSITTVGQWFAAYSNVIAPGYADALSQYNGSAIFVRHDDWVGHFSNFHTLIRGKVNSFGMGTVMHEVMHKQMVGGGFTHNSPADSRDMETALEAAGATQNTDDRNVVSYEFGRACFDDY